MLRTQIYLPGEQIKLLKRIAYTQEVTLSKVIRDLVREKLLHDKEDQEVGNVGSYLLSLAQKAKKMEIKAPKDLASRLDDYLYGQI